MTHSYSNRHVVPTTVLTRSRLVPLNAARPVTTAVPQTTGKNQRPVDQVVNKAHSQIQRPINHRPTPKNSNFNQKVTTVKAKKVNVVQDDSVPTSPMNDRYKSGEGYHVVPPSYTRTFMPLKPNLVFHDALTANETIPNMFNVETSITKPTKDISQSNKPSVSIIEDWVSDSEDKSEGLESVEARLVVYQQNKNVFEEDIKLLKLDVMLKDNALVELRKNFEKAEKERDDLKLTLEKFQTSSKNLSKPLESKITDKTRLRYDNQVFNSHVFDCDELRSSESDDSVPTSPMNDRYKSGEGYHVVPPSYTRTFMPFKPNLVFHDALTANETIPNMFNVETSITKPTKDMSQSNKPSVSIIEDWVSDSKDKSEGEPMPTQKAPSFV
nr:hypothetical protein [Tanacetum cinerariifolium]